MPQLEPLSKQEPENPRGGPNQGAANWRNPVIGTGDKQQKAIASFKQAVELNPKAPHVAYNLGLIYRDRKETEQALHWFGRALEANPNDKDASNFIEQLSNPPEESELS